MQGFIEGESADLFSPNSHLLQETIINLSPFPWVICQRLLLQSPVHTCNFFEVRSIIYHSLNYTVWSHQVSYFYPSIKCSIFICIQSSIFILSYFRFNLENLTKQRNTECILYITYSELRKPLMAPHLFVDDLTEK